MIDPLTDLLTWIFVLYSVATTTTGFADRFYKHLVEFNYIPYSLAPTHMHQNYESRVLVPGYARIFNIF